MQSQEPTKLPREPKPQGQPYLRPGLTKRQTEVLERLEQGYQVRQIARDMGVTRNAVYQHIDRLRGLGALPEAFTASGQPPRQGEAVPVGSVSLGAPALAPRESRLAGLRELARGGADEGAYAAAIEAAISSGDVPALAYELGRADAEGRDDLPRKLAEAALRRLAVLDPDRDSA
jgi:transposase-like protein